MLERLKSARLLWPLIMTVIGASIMVGLGTWQLQRKAWKEELIRLIEARIHAAPRAVEGTRAGLEAVAADEYLPATLKGRFLHDKERHVFAVEDSKAAAGTAPAQDGGLGWYVFTPFETTEGTVLFVNRGFVPDARKDAAARAEGQLQGTVTVTGLVRHRPEKGTFEQAGDGARNTYYWRDLQSMARDVGLPAEKAELGFYVDALREPQNPGGWPRGGTTRLDIPNRHLEYVLTWYGLALTLIAVFAAFAWPRLRATQHRTGHG